MMKKSEIIACIKDNKNISDYEINISNKQSRELFYVLKHLEINRAVNVETISVHIYVSDNKTVGSSIVTITAADDRQSLSKKLTKAVVKAKAAKNPYYPLAEKTKNIVEDTVKKKDLNEIACKIAKAVFKADVYKNGWINSTEIFVSQYTNNFINSKGINHKTNSFKIEIECIPTWSNKKEEFELYKFYETSKIDYSAIAAEVDEILSLAKDRSVAKTLNDISIDKDIKVLVKNDMLETIIEALTNDLSYRENFMKQNHYQIGDAVAKQGFSLTMKPTIAGCSNSRKYDGNGVVLKQRKIIADGKVVANYGDIRFGYYLKQKNITGNLPVCELKADGIDYEKEKHLIIENFSAPQLEINSGYWGGEVRLARYFDGKKYIPISGFSISGMLFDNLLDVQFSKQQVVMPSYKGPKYFIFKNINID